MLANNDDGFHVSFLLQQLSLKKRSNRMDTKTCDKTDKHRGQKEYERACWVNEIPATQKHLHSAEDERRSLTIE